MSAANAQGSGVLNLCAASGKAFEIWYQVAMVAGVYSLHTARGDLLTAVANPALGKYKISARGLPTHTRHSVSLKRAAASTALYVAANNDESLGIAASYVTLNVLDAIGGATALNNGDTVYGVLQFMPGSRT